MEPSAFGEAADCSVTQEFPSILRSLTVHYHFHKSPPLVLILSRITLLLTIPFYLSETCFNVVFLSKSKALELSLSFWLSHQNPISIPLLPMHTTCPGHFSLLDLIILIVLDEVQKL
jgi:hypothetical protein